MAPDLHLRAALLALGCAVLIGVRAQAPSCKLFVHGTFLLPGDHAGEEMRIVRHGSTQKEIGKNGHRSQYRVRWVDDCTYLLYDRKVKRGLDKHPSSPTDTLTVRILDTWEYGYAYRATSNFSTQEVQGTLEMVVPKGYGGITIGF